MSFEHLRQRQHQHPDQTMAAMQSHQHDHAHVESPPRPLIHGATHLGDMTSNGGSRQSSNAIHDSNSMILTRNLIASAIENSHSHTRAHGGADSHHGVSSSSGSSSRRNNGSSNAVSPTISALETLDTAMASAVAAAAARNAGLPSTSNPSSPSAGAYPSEHSENGRILGASYRGGGSSNNGSSSSHDNNTNQSSGPSASNRAEDHVDRYDKNPMIIRWPADDWESWFQSEKAHGRWNLIRHRQRDKDCKALSFFNLVHESIVP